MQHHPPKQVFGPSICRISDVMAHSARFAFRGTRRLAFAAGVSPASVSRIIHGELNPSAVMLARITTALEKEFGHRIDPRDLLAEYGQFPTRFVCDLLGCPGCLPDRAFDEFGDLTATFTNIKPGQWVTSRYPQGFGARKEENEK